MSGARSGFGVVAVVLTVLVGLPLAVSLSAAAALSGGSVAGGQPGSASGSGGGEGPGSTGAVVGGIPAAYLADFRQSGARFGVPWGILAGIYRLECDFGQSRLAGCSPPGTENGAGAQGPGQFLAPTWRRGLAPDSIIEPGPPTVSVADGYATDGDGDGVADVWNPADAIASTARLLAANGAADGDLEQAVFAYNHDPTYVDDVMALAAGYQAAPAASVSPGAGSAMVQAVLATAKAQLGKPYLWGGAGPGSYDCSGLVMVAYADVGLALPHNAAAQYQLTANHPVPLSALEPGDLVFFGTSVPGIEHVGIVVGGGEMIDAPHSGAVVRVEPYDWNDLLVATRPLD